MKSVINQTYKAIECIVVNDATKDDSMEKCEKLIADFNLNSGGIIFKIVNHEVNRGLSAARNTGTKIATGTYIYYLDSDDEITPDCIEKLVVAAKEHPDSEVVIGNSLMIRDNKVAKVMVHKESPSIINSNEEIAFCYHRNWLPVNAWNKLVKLSFLEKHEIYFKEGIIIEDVLWMFYILKYISKVVVVKDVTYHYYKRPDSIMNSSDDVTMSSSYAIIYNEILNHLTLGREEKELNRYVEGFCKRYLRYIGTVPDYDKLFGKFVLTTKKYRCINAYFKLRLIQMLKLIPSGLKVLLSLQDIRKKIK